MAFASYSDLQTAIASFLHRDDVTSEIQDFIKLAEADMQVRAQLSEWDSSGSVTVSSGTGALPSDHAQTHSASWGSETSTMLFLPPTQFDSYALANTSGTPIYYTIRGANMLVSPSNSGTVTIKYRARFTGLSVSSTSNSLLTMFPDAYLSGALMHAANWTKDREEMNTQAALFEACIRRIKTYMLGQKYPLGLQMRVS